ncbi:hypothetical protein U1Q18_036762 [Sarracenia purpurea var. burkii]
MKCNSGPSDSALMLAPKIQRVQGGKSSRSPAGVPQQSPSSQWDSIIKFLDSLMKCCTFSNGEYVKSGLAELEKWIISATEEVNMVFLSSLILASISCGVQKVKY